MTMSKSVTVQARMEPELKQQADIVLAALGINATTAITLFYTQMVRHRGIPLELKIPNEQVVDALHELKDPLKRKDLKASGSISELMADLNS
jgi:DNA-damage-inducible protein J